MKFKRNISMALIRLRTLLMTEHDHREFKIKQNQRITKVRLENMNSYVSNQVQLVFPNVTIYCIQQTTSHNSKDIVLRVNNKYH